MAAPCWPDMEPVFSLECAMSETGFTVATTLPWSWQAGPPATDARRSNLLLLKVANLLDQHEPDQEDASKRIEAKLDLMLHWLGRQLFGEYEMLNATPLVLSGCHIEWEDTGHDWVEGNGRLNLIIHPDLPGPLMLVGQLHKRDGYCHVEFDLPDNETSEAWDRWLFRMHRRAIHDARNKTAPD